MFQINPIADTNIATVDNPAYNKQTRTSITQLPELPGDRSIYTSVNPMYETPVSTSTIDSRPPALVRSTFSTADTTQRLSTKSTDTPLMPLPRGETQGQVSGSDTNSH